MVPREQARVSACTVATFASAPQGGSALSWVILGTPALICFGMWVYKHDREVFAPMRNERRLQAARAYAETERGTQPASASESLVGTHGQPHLSPDGTSGSDKRSS